MGLNYDATNVKDFDSLTKNETVTYESLIWATMAVGMNEITEANVDEFYTRVSYWEKVVGPYRHNGDGDMYFTPADVQRFIGLRTNASTLTPTKFQKAVWEAHKRYASYKLR